MPLNINGTTGISGVDGSVSAPAVTGTDSNTGITFPAADTIKFATGGVERMSITNSGFGGIVQGITVFDSYHLSTSISSDIDPITSNIVRNAFTGNAAEIGGGVTNSSGTFSFPSTGKYLVIVNAQYNLNGSDSISLDTKITTNNSSYTTIARAIDGANGTGVRQGNGMSIAFIDVTDVSQVKIQFQVGSIGSGSSVVGNNAFTTTSFTFAKIGET